MTIPNDLICVLDVGKTNVKLALVSAQTGGTVWSRQRAAQALSSTLLPSLDVEGIESWVIGSLASAPGRERIRFIVPVAHGAAATLIDSDDNVIVAPDYEAQEFESVAEPYRAVREPYSSTLSPFLPLGLNLGRQLFYLRTRRQEAFDRATRVLLYPQYWAWRFSGVAAGEVTSLGCHTDLWRPLEKHYSETTERLGLTTLLPPIRKASDVLGAITGKFSDATGIDAACQVVCGIHDSNASYHCHMASRPIEEPLTVISSGTWIVVMARGTDLGRLQESKGMLANVDAGNQPVATARFMGGREYAAIAGPGGVRLTPDTQVLQSIIRQGAMALPPPTESGTPVLESRALIDIQRAGLAILYCALRVDLLLDALGAAGEIVIDGPLAADSLFASILATLRPSARILVSDETAGSARGATILAGGILRSLTYRNADSLDLNGLNDYRAAWRARVASQESPRATR